MLRSAEWRAARSRAVLASDAQLSVLLQLQACAARRGSAEFDRLLALYRGASIATDEAQAAFARLHYCESRGGDALSARVDKGTPGPATC